MKKIFLVLSIIVGSLVLAQEKIPGFPITYGVKGGLNLSDTSNYWEGKAGFNVGGFVNIPLGSSFSLQPELLYSQYGAFDRGNGSVRPIPRDARVSLDYITVPVMLQYNLGPKFYFEAGPEFGYLANAKYKYEGTLDSGTERTTDIGSKMNKFNLGLGLGLGFSLYKNLGMNVRYVAGLTEAIKENQGKTVTNNTFQLGLTYKFK